MRGEMPVVKGENKGGDGMGEQRNAWVAIRGLEYVCQRIPKGAKERMGACYRGLRMDDGGDSR